MQAATTFGRIHPDFRLEAYLEASQLLGPGADDKSIRILAITVFNESILPRELNRAEFKDADV